MGGEQGLAGGAVHLRGGRWQGLGPGQAVDQVAGQQHDGGRGFAGIGMQVGQARFLAGEGAQLAQRQERHHRQRRGAVGGVAAGGGAPELLMDLAHGGFAVDAGLDEGKDAGGGGSRVKTLGRPPGEVAGEHVVRTKPAPAFQALLQAQGHLGGATVAVALAQAAPQTGASIFGGHGGLQPGTHALGCRRKAAGFGQLQCSGCPRSPVQNPFLRAKARYCCQS